MGKETLCQAFLIHGQCIYLQILNPFLDFIQELLIHPVFHITDGNVSVGALSGGCDFHGKPGIPDSPPNQGSVKNQGFHKTIPGAPHDLIFFRFADTTGRIGAAVNRNTFIITVNKETGHTGQQLDGHILVLGKQSNLAVRNILFGEAVGVLGHILWLDGGEHLQNFQQGIILCKTIYEIKTCFPAADVDYAVYHVKIRLYIQLLVKVSNVVL